MAKVRVGGKNTDCDIFLSPGNNLYTGVTKFIDEFGEVNSLEEDVLNLASGIFATDLAVKREEREHYVRTIKLTIEVINVHAFERVKEDIQRALYVISKDNWSLFFVQKKGTPTTALDWEDQEGAALLFSGGIDSMAGAAELLRQNKQLVLVSHNSHANHVIDNCQNAIHSVLEGHFTKSIRHLHIKVYGRNHPGFPFPKDENRENTQRTRSFLFLAIAALCARRCKFNRVVYMAENGQFAIHLPLTAARVGPFSTHTADPKFVLLMERIFKILLSNQTFEITNPFLYLTKAEVFGVMPAPLMKAAEASASCWMISRTPGNKHCGYCIPCISRRIAIEYNNLKFKEYNVDLFKTDVTKLDDTDDRKRNLVDYLEFISRFFGVTDGNRQILFRRFPELYNTGSDVDKVIKMYERVAVQSLEVLSKYPKVKKLLA